MTNMRLDLNKLDMEELEVVISLVKKYTPEEESIVEEVAEETDEEIKEDLTKMCKTTYKPQQTKKMGKGKKIVKIVRWTDDMRKFLKKKGPVETAKKFGVPENKCRGMYYYLINSSK